MTSLGINGLSWYLCCMHIRVLCHTAAQMDADHDDVTTWKRFPHYWPFMRRYGGIHRWLADTPHKGPVMWGFYNFIDANLNQQLNRVELSANWYSMTLMWRHCDSKRIVFNLGHLTQVHEVYGSWSGSEGVSVLSKHRNVSNIRRTKYQNLTVSRLILQLPLPNPLKPGVKLRIKM